MKSTTIILTINSIILLCTLKQISNARILNSISFRNVRRRPNSFEEINKQEGNTDIKNFLRGFCETVLFISRITICSR